MRAVAIAIAASNMADAILRALVDDLAPGLTCHEAEAVEALYIALGRPNDALRVMEAHAAGDTDPEDKHYGGD